MNRRRQLDRHFLPFLAKAVGSRLAVAFPQSALAFVATYTTAMSRYDQSTSFELACVALVLVATTTYLCWVSSYRIVDFSRHKLFRLRQRHLLRQDFSQQPVDAGIYPRRGRR
jgi:hypothetical protein